MSKQLKPDNSVNPFQMQRHGKNANQGVVQAEEMRAMAEVQASYVIAKKYPRDKFQAMAAILEDCSRFAFADKALYSFPRGGATVSGPSVHLARCIAQHWQNFDFGVKELSQNDGVSEMLAFATDLETNVKNVKQFAVVHQRHTKTSVYDLTDPRDIYEVTANNAARRERACILALIPADVIETAVDAVKKTVARGPKNVTRETRVKNLLLEFAKWRVTKEDIERYLGGPTTTMTDDQLTEFVGIYQSIKEGQSKPADFFGPDAAGSTIQVKPQPRTTDTIETVEEIEAQPTPGTEPAPWEETTPPADNIAATDDVF